MNHHKYNVAWVGIDGGREGLWTEPTWSGVLRIISVNDGQLVYDPGSSIYLALEHEFPDESWRSVTADGKFRPLFRDYPNSWTRTGVVNLRQKTFRTTLYGRAFLEGRMSKADIFIEMFKNHSERTQISNQFERPFEVLSAAFLEAVRPMSTHEIYWGVMKNYRPAKDHLSESLISARYADSSVPDPTSVRRIKSILSTMRAAELIQSTQRNRTTFWSALNTNLLQRVVNSSTDEYGVI